MDRYQKSIVHVLSYPEEKEKTYKLLVEVDQLLNDKQKIHTQGKTILYISKDSSISNLVPGDELIIVNKFKEIPANTNPGSFDYKRYCKFQNIDYTAFLSRKEWIKTEKSHSGFLLHLRKLAFKLV